MLITEEILSHLKRHDLILLDKNVKSAEHVLIKSKYGIHKIRTYSLYIKGLPTIQTALDKREYFKNQSNELHKNKYDYSKVEYKTGKQKVTIICLKHGAFEQTPGSHLKGSGCPKCGHNKIRNSRLESICGWKLTDWKSLAQNSKYYDDFKLYILEVYDKKEKFIKIGRTFSTVKHRFKSSTDLPYFYNILKVIRADAELIFDLENKLKMNFKFYKYIPNKKFSGMYECYNISIKSVLTQVK